MTFQPSLSVTLTNSLRIKSHFFAVICTELSKEYRFKSSSLLIKNFFKIFPIQRAFVQPLQRFPRL